MFVKHNCVLIFLLSLFLVSVSVLIPQNIQNQEELLSIKLGMPLKFLEQNQSRYNPPVPAKISLSSPWENPIYVSWLKFSFSVIIMFVIVGLGLNISMRLFQLFH